MATDRDALDAGRAALRAGRWDEAADVLEGMVHQAAGTTDRARGGAAEDGREPVAPAALEALAEVRYRQGDYAAAVDLHERAFAAYRSSGETRRAAVLAAYHLAFEYAAVYGNAAAANGWLERGKRLADAAGDCPERGWVELACALAARDLVDKERHVASAISTAQRFGDVDLEFDALAYRGVCLVERGRLDAGMRDLDEAAAAVRGGEVGDASAAGEIYCKMLQACEMTLDVRRAQEWTEAAAALAGRTSATWASAICRMHYGAVLTAAGRWDQAETELAASVAGHERGYRALRAGALVRLADLRVRQGRREEAERLLAGHERESYAVRPLARARLAAGEHEVAAALLRRHVRRHGDGVLQAPVLALLVEADVAGGRRPEAEAGVARLTAIARQTGRPLHRALAAAAAARVDDAGAVEHLEAALDGFADAGLPLEQAQVRLDLARRVAADRPALAAAEAANALAVFDRLGASWEADAAAALLRSLGVRGRTGPRDGGALTRREEEVLGLVGLGLSNPEIAARLFISPKTASHHVSNVLAKLGLRNRAEAAAFAEARRLRG